MATINPDQPEVGVPEDRRPDVPHVDTSRARGEPGKVTESARAKLAKAVMGGASTDLDTFMNLDLSL